MPEARDELRDELLAVTAARRELSTDDEHFLVESFIDRLDKEIDARVDARVEARLAHAPARRRGIEPWVIPAALGAAIPIVAISGAFAGGIGVVFALAFVAILLGLYAEYNQR